MSEVVSHYEELLAQHYTWMLGADFDELVTEQRRLLSSCGATSPQEQNTVALDLGCGSGIHSVALAHLGHDTVLSVDISATLIAELADRASRFPGIRPIRADLCAGLDAIVEPRSIAAAVCMGDTLPHLPDTSAVRRLLDDTFDVLLPGGVFVLSFRDLTTPLVGLDRFIPVRADQHRIMTCFLEDEGDAVRVTDLIHMKDPDGSWRLGKSSYRKLRLPPVWVAGQLREAGFAVAHLEPGPRGTCVITARRPE
ncbi:class I SAM-dependent methyltransferase [Actinopolymorpha pittospori]|uniref:SAM-dependent methyltransferase n=1 Tax=Actinopolymorpha pittospori TaxID=648752 RepID=A0A927MUI2_9ACTN|nr:class I SAM-dependent methyltransferase [Actinopolymorpha pittospori]MBE1603552.1 SAM-dependent methyltransferase [Actinopolymorpha pittospori]